MSSSVAIPNASIIPTLTPASHSNPTLPTATTSSQAGQLALTLNTTASKYSRAPRALHQAAKSAGSIGKIDAEKEKEAIKPEQSMQVQSMQVQAKNEKETKKEHLKLTHAKRETQAGGIRKQEKGVFTIGDVLPMSFHVVGDTTTKRSAEMLVTVRIPASPSLSAFSQSDQTLVHLCHSFHACLVPLVAFKHNNQQY